MHEQIIEQGFVLKADNDTAEIALTNSDACESCDSLFCSANSKGENVLIADNEIQAKVGDFVKVMVTGSAMMKATFLLYVVPLLILVGSIMLFYEVFEYSEFFSFIAALVITFAYYLLLMMIGDPKNDKKPMPKIISIKEFHQTVEF